MSLTNAYIERKSDELNLFLSFNDNRVGTRVIEIPLKQGMDAEQVANKVAERMASLLEDMMWLR